MNSLPHRNAFYPSRLPFSRPGSRSGGVPDPQAGANRTLRLRSALGSTNEVIACLDVAVALGYVAPDERLVDALSKVRATLLELLSPRR